MSTRLHNRPLLEELVGFVRLPWYVLTLLIAALLLVFLLLTAYLGGAFTGGINWNFWRLGIQAAVVTYIFLIYPLMQRLWNRAIQSLQLLLPEKKREKIIKDITSYNHRREWLALLAGLVFFVALSQPWSWVQGWLDVYSLVTSILMFCLLGWLIYNGSVSTYRIMHINRQHLELDIFNIGRLLPVAHWSLGISFAFICGITISVLFQPWETLLHVQNLILYSILIFVTVVLFFMSMWSTHQAIVGAKRRELFIVQKHLASARTKLREQISTGIIDGIDKMYSAVAAWGIYERQILETREWPFNAGIIRRLVVSVLFPSLVYLAKILFGLRLGT